MGRQTWALLPWMVHTVSVRRDGVSMFKKYVYVDQEGQPCRYCMKLKARWSSQYERKGNESSGMSKNWGGQCDVCVLFIVCTWKDMTKGSRKKQKASPLLWKTVMSVKGLCLRDGGGWFKVHSIRISITEKKKSIDPETVIPMSVPLAASLLGSLATR